MRTEKPVAGEIYVCVVPHGNNQPGLQLPGSHQAVRANPSYWAKASDGQPGIDAVSAAFSADLEAARLNRELQWYGVKEPEPEQAVQMRAIQDFDHRGYHVRAGDIFGDDTEIVREMREQFQPCLVSSQVVN